jgi:hypothetical protein
MSDQIGQTSGGVLFFHELAREIRTALNSQVREGDFVEYLVSLVIRDPMSDEETEASIVGEYNPISTISLNCRDQIFIGKKFISKKRALKICGLYDGEKLVDVIDDSFSGNKEQLMNFLYIHDVPCASTDVLGPVIKDVLFQIFRGLSLGQHDVRIIVEGKKTSIGGLSNDKVYYKEGKLYVVGEVIELPVKLDSSEINEFESAYIEALCEAYADALSKQTLNPSEIATLPKRYQKDFYEQRKAFLSAESIRRSLREVYDDGENQFNILKEDTFDGIKTTYYDEYENGYRRMLAVLNKVTDIQLSKSRVMMIKNLIGNCERIGIIHILVNDGIITSWVNVYE